jgi:hypothetical protein
VLFVPLTTDGVTTTLWSWESECTQWLRTAFTASWPLPGLTGPVIGNAG